MNKRGQDYTYVDMCENDGVKIILFLFGIDRFNLSDENGN